MTMHRYCFQLTPLTPIHIGSGDTLQPFEYVVAGDTLYRFTLDDLLLAMDREDQARFVEVIEDSVSTTRQFVARHVVAAAEVARFTATVSPAARALYDGRMEGAGHPEVHACIRTSDRAYLPGSSLKGALRTALLYDAMEKESTERDARRLEQRVFHYRRIQQDPFRAFKVGDGQALEGPAHVRAVSVNTRHGSRWSEDVSVLIETIPGALSDNADEVSSHPVTFDTEFYRTHERAFRLSPGAVLSACRDFYSTHLAAERDYTRDLPQTTTAYHALAAYAESLPGHACLVRLAWGSGRDAVTVAYALRNASQPRSRRLTADGFPLGWAELAILDAEGGPVAADEKLAGVAPPPKRDKEPSAEPRDIRDLREGMELEGLVRNTVRFGAFVDVGVGKDGLIHVSQLSEGFVETVESTVRSGDRVRVRVLSVEPERERIGLKLLEVVR
jgi:hypothetical protein